MRNVGPSTVNLFLIHCADHLIRAGDASGVLFRHADGHIHHTPDQNPPATGFHPLKQATFIVFSAVEAFLPRSRERQRVGSA